MAEPNLTSPAATEFPQAPIIAETDAYVEMIRAISAFQDAAARAAPPVHASLAFAARIHTLSEQLTAFETAQADRPYGRRDDVAGRGQFLVPAYDRQKLDGLGGSIAVQLSEIYHGAFGIAHGGAVSLLFDDILGFVANIGRPFARTAYLHVDYRAVTPIDAPLMVDCWVDREVGRKLYLKASLMAGATITAQAEGLFLSAPPIDPRATA